MDINELKKRIFSDYMEQTYNFASSDEYKKRHSKIIWEFLLYFIIFMAIGLLLNKDIFFAPGIYINEKIKLAFETTTIVLFSVFFLVHINNSRTTKNIKNQFINNILQNLLDIKYYTKEPIDGPCLINNDEIIDFNLAESFDNKIPDDTFIGNYNGIGYTLQEIKLHKVGDRFFRFSGLILKTNINTGINGWIEVKTKDMDRIMTYSFCWHFVTCGIIIAFAIAIFFFAIFYNSDNPFFDSIFICGIISAILSVLISIIPAFIIAKHCVKSDNIKLNQDKKNRRYSTLEDINNQFDIKSSDNIVNINETMISQLADVFKELSYLFKTNKIKCKIYNDKIMLAIASLENMFETVDFYTSPTNPKVADRFVSQISGIILFLDYISNNMTSPK